MFLFFKKKNILIEKKIIEDIMIIEDYCDVMDGARCLIEKTIQHRTLPI